jgi:hypothetical protein
MEKLTVSKRKPPMMKGYELTLDKGKTRIIPKKPKVVKELKEYRTKKKEENFFDIKFVKDLI